MMRLSSAIAFCGLSATLAAQPVMQYSNVPVMQLYEWYIVTNPGTSDPTPIGPNATWNFSTATLQLAGNATLKSTTGTSYASQYPAATHVLEFTSGVTTLGYMVMDITATGIDLIAQYMVGDPSATV